MPTEWPNFTKSDVFYCPKNRRNLKSNPPILIEVQYFVDMNFYRLLMNYSSSIWKSYNSVSIVLSVVVANTSPELADMLRDSTHFLFARSLPCAGWAKGCYIVNKQSIAEFLNAKPLNPLVALSHVLIERITALIDIERRDDQTVQEVFRIARRIVCRELLNDETDLASYEEIYHYAINGFNLAKDILTKNPVSESTTKRAIDCIDDHVKALSDIRKRRFVDESSLVPAAASIVATDSVDTSGLVVPAGSAVSNSSLASSTTLASDSIAARVRARDSRRKDQMKNWEFVDEYRAQQGSCMDWDSCYLEGKKRGLFQQYSSVKSVSFKLLLYKLSD